MVKITATEMAKINEFVDGPEILYKILKTANLGVDNPIIALSIVPPEITGLVNVLFVNVSVDVFDTNVSVKSGSVKILLSV